MGWGWERGRDETGSCVAFATAAAASSTLYYLFENKFRSSCRSQTHVHAHWPNALYIHFTSQSALVCVCVWLVGCMVVHDVHIV